MSDDTDTRPRFVYRAYDAEGRCLYIGCTWQPRVRRRAHELHSPWFAEAVRCVMTGPLPKQAAFDLERELIWKTRPPYNKPPRWPWPRVA